MTMLTQALVDLEQRMGALGRHEALRALRPGAAPGGITTALTERGLPVPPEVQALFAWHDGVMVPPGGLPGLLIQADRLKSLLDDLIEEAPDSVAAERLSEWVGAYEAMMREAGLRLPYPGGSQP